MPHSDQHPIAVIGAGPVGLAAAAHLVARCLTPVVFERGALPAASLRQWGHVRVFSPWRYNLDALACALLREAGWQEPDPDALPTGDEIIDHYLAPLAAHPGIAPHLQLSATVTGITRQGRDRQSSAGRADAPFSIRWTNRQGEHVTLARAVIDASGTWTRPNPMGADGLPVVGEPEAAASIAYGIPDILGSARADYAGKRVLVVGSGHSAVNTALALMTLQESAPQTRVYWALRNGNLEKLFGGGLDDQLPARGALGLAARKAVEAGRLTMLTSFSADRIERTDDGLAVSATLDGVPFEFAVDRAIVAAGFRPDREMLAELRVELDPVVEAPPALAPLIDPNLHSCGTVPPHGILELTHPEPGFFIAGAKAYGRAPTFLMATGYEQVRSIVAELAGDHVAARQVHLVLPETGVCSAAPILGEEVEAAASCCGGPAPAGTDACCLEDAQAKSREDEGFGCTPAPVAADTVTGCCAA